MVKRRSLWLATALLFLGGLWLVTLFLPHKTPATNSLPKSQHSNATTPVATANASQLPSLGEIQKVINNIDNDGDGSYTVTSATQPYPGWIVAMVNYKNSYGTFIEYSILQKVSDGSYTPTLGTSTSYPYSFLKSKGVPDQVIAAVPTY